MHDNYLDGCYNDGLSRYRPRRQRFNQRKRDGPRSSGIAGSCMLVCGAALLRCCVVLAKRGDTRLYRKGNMVVPQYSCGSSSSRRRQIGLLFEGWLSCRATI